ncbi:MAG: hypothetical protein IH991_23300, partial [Planctomycetes bacterium]|nr:hypothetical protein [Planctomycetota bacterium]
QEALSKTQGVSKIKVENRLKLVSQLIRDINIKNPKPKDVTTSRPPRLTRNKSFDAARLLASLKPVTGRAIKRLRPGLITLHFPRQLSQQGEGEVWNVEPERLGSPIGSFGITVTMSPWKFREDLNAMAVGFIRIPKAGEYAFKSNNFYDRNVLIVAGKTVCRYRDLDRGEPPQIQLEEGYVPIVSLGFVGSRGSVDVQWKPPGQTELSPIPPQFLFHPSAELLATMIKTDQVSQIVRGENKAPLVQIMTAKEFEKSFSARFPKDANIGAQGRAEADSVFAGTATGKRIAQNVFAGNRNGHSWTSDGAKSEFKANWDPSAKGRYILFFGRSGPGKHPWGKTLLRLNGKIETQLAGMSTDKVCIIDLGVAVPISSLELSIDGIKYHGIAGLEIHP